MTTNQRNLPDYTHKDEVHNSITHFVGFLFGIIVLILFVYYEIKYPSLRMRMYPFYIYVFTMMFMFFNSGFYHSRKLGSKSRCIMRMVDHSDIYLFVAGTYTPICIYGITNSSISTALLIIEWVSAGLGIIFTLVGLNHKVLKFFAFAIYLIGGWSLIVFYPLNIGLEFSVFLFILIGGIVYTIGAILYGVGKKIIWFHTIFHYFILVAAILQFVGVWFLLNQII